jgi:hypothetical protein
MNKEIHKNNDRNRDKKANKKRVNTTIFFTLLVWLAVYLWVIKHKILAPRLTPVLWVVIITIQVFIFLLAKYLVPGFEFVLKLTSKIGTVIFGIITTLVYYFILTPISLFKRLIGKPLLHVKIDKTQVSYYEQWETSTRIEKQY